MARIPKVTRTITTTKATALCLDIEVGEPENRVLILPRTYKDGAAALKAAKDMYETDTFKVVHIVHTETQETLYGMTEQKFIELAEILPNRRETCKPEPGEEIDINN